MTKLLISPYLVLASLLVPSALAEVSPTIVPVNATANAFQVIDDARVANEDADLAFIRKAIASNEAAIEAAKAILKTSFDADIRMLAGDSLKTHDTELRTLKAWLNLHGPQEIATPAAPTPVKAPVQAAAKPVAQATVAKPSPVAAPVKTVALVTPPPVALSASVPPVQPKPAAVSTTIEVTITAPRPADSSPTEAPLPGTDISLDTVEEPSLPLLDVPPVPVSLTPVTPQIPRTSSN